MGGGLFPRKLTSRLYTGANVAFYATSCCHDNVLVGKGVKGVARLVGSASGAKVLCSFTRGTTGEMPGHNRWVHVVSISLLLNGMFIM